MLGRSRILLFLVVQRHSVYTYQTRQAVCQGPWTSCYLAKYLAVKYLCTTDYRSDLFYLFCLMEINEASRCYYKLESEKKPFQHFISLQKTYLWWNYSAYFYQNHPSSSYCSDEPWVVISKTLMVMLAFSYCRQPKPFHKTDNTCACRNRWIILKPTLRHTIEINRLQT